MRSSPKDRNETAFNLDEEKDTQDKENCQSNENQNKVDKYEALSRKYKPVEVTKNIEAVRPPRAECRGY